MGRKITIRRVGSFIPTMCLVVFLLLCAIIGWLSIAGLPGCVLRKIEQEAHAAGIPLKVKSLYLAPFHGLALKAEGVRIFATKEDAAPLLQADLTASLSLYKLLKGEIALNKAKLRSGQIRLPLQESPEYLHVDDIMVVVRQNKSGDYQISSGSLSVDGVSVLLSGEFLASSEEPTNTTQAESEQPSHFKPDLPSLLHQIAPYAAKVHHVITEQNWELKDTPELRIHLRKNRLLSVSVQGDMPKYDFDGFHVRDARFDLLYRNGSLVINSLSFNTIDPPSTAVLQAAYYARAKELGFRLDSTIPLIPMLTELLVNEGIDVPLLKKITHAPEKAPFISLNGNIDFEEDFTPAKIHVYGKLEQEDLYIGEHCIDMLGVEFFYHDGNFNLHHLRLNFGSNRFDISATANNGEGAAQLSADFDIEEGVALINEFTSTPLVIPEDWQLGDRLKLQVKAKLTTPIFDTEHKDWKNFTPDIHTLSMALELDRLQYGDISLVSPRLQTEINNIVQAENKCPSAADQAKITFHAQEVSWHNATLQNTDFSLSADSISHQDGELTIGRLHLLPGEQGSIAHLEMDGLQANNLSLSLDMSRLSYKDDQLRIAELCGDMSAADLTRDKLKLEELTFSILSLRNLQPLSTALADMFSETEISSNISAIFHEDQKLGQVELQASMEQGQVGSAHLSFIPEGEGELAARTNKLQTSLNWANADRLLLEDLRAEIAPSSLGSLLEHFEVTIPHLKLPDKLTAVGLVNFNTRENRPELVHLNLDIPRLIRTPFKVVAFQGKEVPVSLKADVHVRPANDNGYHYQVDLEAGHEQDVFRALVKGHTDGRLTVTGNNTIRADVVDQLIDSTTAHNIIRDFRFTHSSRNIITDIDVSVDYSEGLSVDSYCKVELRNVGFQLSVIEEDDKGRERQRTDLGPDPYSYTEHATCYVRSKVRYDYQQNGTPVKDECSITIGDINMVYNNTPWLIRQDFSALGTSAADVIARHRNTTLTGNAVIIDVENSFVELVNLHGEAFLAYALGMYYAPLHSFLEDVITPTPVRIETPGCVFPIYSDCKRPMSGTIKAKSSALCGFRFLGTTIPLRHFNGFINLTDDYVLLDKMNASCWEGVLNAIVKIGFSTERTSFDGMVSASNMNLQSILKSYNTDFTSALCNGQIRFRSPTPDLNDIQAYGEVSVVNGDLMGFSLFQPVGDLVTDLPSKLLLLESAAQSTEEGREPGYIAKAFSGTGNVISDFGKQAKKIPGYNHIFAYDIQDAHAKFAIAGGRLKAYDMTAHGYNLDVDMKLNIDLDTLYIRGNLWPKISSLPTIILSPITFLSDFMIDIVIHGEIDTLDWEFGLDRRLKSAPPSASGERSANGYKPRKADARKKAS